VTTASSTQSPAIVWLRDDLRIADNPALVAAVEYGGPVVVLWLLAKNHRASAPSAAPRAGGCTTASSRSRATCASSASS
jgi:hypothetical protein